MSYSRLVIHKRLETSSEVTFSAAQLQTSFYLAALEGIFADQTDISLTN